MSRVRRAMDVAARRRRGMSEGARERVAREQEKMDDWKAVCRHCKENLRGTIAQLKTHECKNGC